jgi:uncharacterized protein (TIGR02145 family)
MRRLFVIVVLHSLFGIAASAQYVSDWNPDADGDNTIGVNDLLALLSVFEETDSDDDGVYNSQSSEYAADWNPDADGDNSITVTDLLGLLSVFEETDSDNDGIFDSQDDCVGTFDVCGVCNGTGPSVLIEGSLVCPVYGCTDNAASNFSATANTDDGTCAYGPAQCSGQSTVTYDGFTYNLVGIGTQCWFKENLRNDSYRNGDEIPGNLTDLEWGPSELGATCVYGEGIVSIAPDDNTDENLNLIRYGRLYNWHATDDPRGLCPTGFHVPSLPEWNALVDFLGGPSAAYDALRTADYEVNYFNWNGSNSSGFSALPSGLRQSHNDFFYGRKHLAWWWSSTPSTFNWDDEFYGGGSYIFSMHGQHGSTYSFDSQQRLGLAVRCLRDSLETCWDPDADGVCGENEVSGCTDVEASNFNSTATHEDGTCTYPAEATCDIPSVLFDGYNYTLVRVGDRCWFAENLRADNYGNGDPIIHAAHSDSWWSSNQGAQFVYGEADTSDCSVLSIDLNLSQYGRLYSFNAITDPRGLCPAGFHVPSDGEWQALEQAMGGRSVAGFRLKATTTDIPAWNGLNSAGFGALPGGVRGNNTSSVPLDRHEGRAGAWWSSSLASYEIWIRTIGRDSNQLYRHHVQPNSGCSVRCIQDSIPSCFDPDLDGVCAENELSGCMNDSAFNFNPNATEEDGTCLFGPSACLGMTSLEYNGHSYALTGIGTKCWFKENLRTETYANGDTILRVNNTLEWNSLTLGAQCAYADFDSEGPLEPDGENEASNPNGRLYNWPAVNDARGLCPQGFMVPGDADWNALEESLGLTSVEVETMGWRGTDEGNHLKSSDTDSPPWNGSNSSGFSGIPGGGLLEQSGFEGYGTQTHWWSTTQLDNGAIVRGLSSEVPQIERTVQSTQSGLSIRCIKNTSSDCSDLDEDGVCAEHEIGGCTDSTAMNFDPNATEQTVACDFSAPPQCHGLSSIRFDNHVYQLVGIGNQCWFKENLQTRVYRNCDSIAGGMTSDQWISTRRGAQAAFQDDEEYAASYGRLYNYYAVSDPRGLCPIGFRVPYYSDWILLGNAVNAVSDLKASPSDSPPWNGTNLSGFTALPNGTRTGGTFWHWQGYWSKWWILSPVNDGNTWQMVIGPGLDLRRLWPDAMTYDSGRTEGFAVRCIKDYVVGSCWDFDGDGFCAQDEVSGCTDTEAENYSMNASHDDGSCTYTPPSPCGDLISIDYSGYEYTLVPLGGECWFGENLRATTYQNGDFILSNLDSEDWLTASEGAQSIYEDADSNLTAFGRLYNWLAVNDPRGLCPTGFHVATDADWTNLTESFGGSALAADALKAGTSASSPWDGSIPSSFVGLPGGGRQSTDGQFHSIGIGGFWWAAAADEPGPTQRSMFTADSQVYQLTPNPMDGSSVRCVLD